MFRRLLPVCVAVVLVACGSDTSSPAATDPPPAASGSQVATPGVAVPEALQFSAPLVGGGEIELAALAGRPVLLWFWAPW